MVFFFFFRQGVCSVISLHIGISGGWAFTGVFEGGCRPLTRATRLAGFPIPLFDSVSVATCTVSLIPCPQCVAPPRRHTLLGTLRTRREGHADIQSVGPQVDSVIPHTQCNPSHTMLPHVHVATPHTRQYVTSCTQVED